MIVAGTGALFQIVVTSLTFGEEKMKKIVWFVALFCCLAAPAWAATVEEAMPDVRGAWQLEFTSPDGVQRQPIVIVGREYQQLVAWYVEEDGKPVAIDSARLDGETLVLSTRRQQAEGDMKITLRAQLAGADKCRGEGTYELLSAGDQGNWSFSGRRIQPGEFDATETWKVSFMTPDGERHEAEVMVMEKSGRHYGWYSSKDRELPATSVSLQGERVTLSLSAKTADGDRVDVTFRGNVMGDRVNGTAEYNLLGETGSFPFQGQRRS